jgi:arylsulfatase A-like enzyme
MEDPREFVVTELSFGNWVDGYRQDTFPRARMVRTEKYKYVVFDQGELTEQLMDMNNDPGEMQNLAMDPEYHGVLEAHRELLENWIRETGDSFVRPDTP